MVEYKLKYFKIIKNILYLELKNSSLLLSIDLNQGKINKNNLEKLAVGNTLLIDGILEEDELDYIVGTTGIPSRIYIKIKEKYKPLYFSKRNVPSLLMYN